MAKNIFSPLTHYFSTPSPAPSPFLQPPGFIAMLLLRGCEIIPSSGMHPSEPLTSCHSMGENGILGNSCLSFLSPVCTMLASKSRLVTFGSAHYSHLPAPDLSLSCANHSRNNVIEPEIWTIMDTGEGYGVRQTAQKINQ